MEADSSHEDVSDGPEECNSLLDLNHSLSNTLMKSSSKLHSRSPVEPLSSSSQEIPYRTSSELQLSIPVNSENRGSKISTLDSSSAQPLNSSQASTVRSKSKSELSSSRSADCRRNNSGDEDSCHDSCEDSCEEENECSQSSENVAVKTTKPDFFKAAKFDILKAMKADFCKITKVKVPNGAEAEISNNADDKSEGRVEVIEKISDIKGNVSKDNVKGEAVVKEASEAKCCEEKNGIINNDIAIMEEATANEVTDIEAVIGDNVSTVCDDKKKAKESENVVGREEAELNGDKKRTGSINKKTKANVENDRDNETIENEVSSTTATEVCGAKDVVTPTAKVDLVNEAEITTSRESSWVISSKGETVNTVENVVETAKTDILPEVKMDIDTTENQIGEAMEMDYLDVKKEQGEVLEKILKEEPGKEQPAGSSLVDGQESEEIEAGTGDSVEAGTSSKSVSKEENTNNNEFGCNEDSSNDTLLDEEAKRLDKLDLHSQVTPEPKGEGGEYHRERQYKKLVDLLSKSKFYTDVLLKKVEDDVVKHSRKRKHHNTDKNGDANEENGSPTIDSSPAKRMKVLMDNQRAMYEVASEVMNEKTRRNDGGDTNSNESESAAEVKLAEEIQQPKLLSGGTLRDYQLEGYNWLKVLYENGVNGILADEMGLGKTIQVIALMCHLVEMKVKGPFLIVGPLCTLPNWMAEFKRFAPQLHVKLFHGSKLEREKMWKTLLKRKNINGVSCYPIVVTSYEIPVFEREYMETISWKYIIVDEGHRIKNYNTVLAKVLRTFDSANRLLLTGTPLHNSLSELWALLNFLVPEIFDNLDVFESWFRIEELSDDVGRQKILDEERRKSVLSTLHQILAPFMLRRVKLEVSLDIPKKKEVVVHAPMTDMQFKLYQAVLEKKVGVVRKAPVEDLIIPDINGKRPRRSCTRGKRYEEKGDADLSENSNDAVSEIKNDDINAIVTQYVRVKMQNPQIALKQIASHPYLIHYPLQDDGLSCKIDEAVVKSSGKFLVLDAMLEKLHARGHKVLIFSTLCMLLDIMEDYLSLRTYSYERLDGNVKLADRTDSIHRFNTDPNIFLFLLSTRAGGLGVNLTGADTVIFIDSDWNPQVDLQAQDRCHRIGQTKPVMVYRLVTTGTMEEQLLKRADAKRVLEKLVICKGTSVQKEFDLEELQAILQSRDASDIVYTDGQVLTDEQLEKLLDRSDLQD